MSEIVDGEITGEVTEDVAPKRRGRQPYPRDPVTGAIIRPEGAKAPGRPRSKGSIEAQISGFVTLINLLVRAFKPDYALDQVEQTALVKALDQQCQTSPKFRKYLEKIVAGSGNVNLIGVALIIVSRRVARAGLIPIPSDAPITASQLDDMGGALLYAMTTGNVTSLNVPVS